MPSGPPSDERRASRARERRSRSRDVLARHWKHTSGCVKRSDSWRCTYYCPVGGIVVHVERLLYLVNNYDLRPELRPIRDEARKALRKWDRK